MIFGKEESWGGGQEMNANGDFCQKSKVSVFGKERNIQIELLKAKTEEKLES